MSGRLGAFTFTLAVASASLVGCGGTKSDDHGATTAVEETSAGPVGTAGRGVFEDNGLAQKDLMGFPEVKSARDALSPTLASAAKTNGALACDLPAYPGATVRESLPGEPGFMTSDAPATVAAFYWAAAGAAGGFAMNADMVAEYTPALGQERKTKHHGMVAPYILGNPNDDGLGIKLGVSAGGVATNMDQLFITAAAYPPEILLTGVIVNSEGNRFVAEDSYHSRTSAFVLEQPDQTAYLIVDEAHMQMPEMPLIKFIDGWETVAEMAEALGIPEGNLAATLEAPIPEHPQFGVFRM